MSSLFLHCRPGFEGECAAEIQDHAAECGVSGYCKAKAQSAYVVFQPYDPQAAADLYNQLSFGSLIFCRQWFVVLALRNDLPETDRISPLVESLRDLPVPVNEIFLETPDTNQGKELTVLCRALERPFQESLHQAGYWRADTGQEVPRLHICLLSGTAAYIGYAFPTNSAPLPMGIPRLKFPRGAPSRSTLKLEEAFLHFLTLAQREQLLQPGMRAVDLGAAPGGWTWQLVRRHLYVTAVDNGALDPQLLDSGLVEHVRADGFRYRPAKPVEWMVCDMVEQPIRIATLAAQWLARGWCNYTIFNLKLPMKRRYQEVQRCLTVIEQALHEADVRYEMACKQLFHDREEVTVFLRRDRP